MGGIAGLIVTLLTIVAVMGAILGACAYQILMERKIAAYVQDRVGPNRVGPFGLLQPIADGLKFILKEEIIPTQVEKLFYLIAPGIAMTAALLAFAVVPFGATLVAPDPPAPLAADASPARISEHQKEVRDYEHKLKDYRESYQFVIAPRVDIGFLFTFAISSLAVYGIILGGWSANNKYSLLGGLRSSAQIVSYEIPLGMSVLGVVLVSGSLNLERIIHIQVNGGWNVLYQPLAFLIFMTAMFAECNRLPFDLPEAEQELVGGYHTEYSGMKFAMFFLGEYAHMITTSFMMVVLFFGGWHLPWLTEWTGIGGAIVKLVVFAGKVFLFIFVYMIVRWTIPRFRFDQLMGLAWKTLIPLALLNLVCVMIVQEFKLTQWLLLPASIALIVGTGYITLLWPRKALIRPVRSGRDGRQAEAVL